MRTIIAGHDLVRILNFKMQNFHVKLKRQSDGMSHLSDDMPQRRHPQGHYIHTLWTQHLHAVLS